MIAFSLVYTYFLHCCGLIIVPFVLFRKKQLVSGCLRKSKQTTNKQVNKDTNETKVNDISLTLISPPSTNSLDPFTSVLHHCCRRTE